MNLQEPTKEYQQEGCLYCHQNNDSTCYKLVAVMKDGEQYFHLHSNKENSGSPEGTAGLFV